MMELRLFFTNEEMKTFLEDRGYTVKQEYIYEPGGNHDKEGTHSKQWVAYNNGKRRYLWELFQEVMKQKLLNNTYVPADHKVTIDYNKLKRR